jgi:hypothetical protein
MSSRGGQSKEPELRLGTSNGNDPAPVYRIGASSSVYDKRNDLETTDDTKGPVQSHKAASGNAYPPVDATHTNGERIIEWHPANFISWETMSQWQLESDLEITAFPKTSNGQRSGTSRAISQGKYALIVLNQPIELELEFFQNLWREGLLHPSNANVQPRS